MKNICLFFRLDLPLNLKDYSFFEIGSSNPYFDDQKTKQFVQEYAQKCLLPVNQTILETINRTYGNFKAILSISGYSIELLKKYAPEVISSISELIKTGNIEFTSETYFESYASIFDVSEFQIQVKKHSQILRQTFHQKPITFRNTDLIFSDKIAQVISKLGFKSVITAFSFHSQHNISSDNIYQSQSATDLSIFFQNTAIGIQIAEGLASNNYLNANHIVNEISNSENLTCLEIFYSQFINKNKPNDENNNFILDFGREVLKNPTTFFKTTYDIIKTENAFEQRSFPKPLAFKTQLRNSEPDLFNDLQFDALKKLYSMKHFVQQSKKSELIEIWNKLQHVTHFDRMLTNELTPHLFNGFLVQKNTAHDAFLNFMNVLNDFELHIIEYKK